jgi:glycerophosphoryl diester phosphodiesterase
MQNNKNSKFKKLQYAAGCVSLVVILVGVYLFVYEPAYKGLITQPSQTLVFAHRGFGNHAPDNSLVAAEIAMKENMDGVDVDGQQSLDKEIVIFHDLSVDRLTNATGKVHSKTVVELEGLDLGLKYGKGFAGSFVHTFEDFVQRITPDGILMVELKVVSQKPTGIEERAAEIIKKYNVYDKVYLSSFNPLVLYRLKKIDPQIRTVLIFMDTNWNPELLAEIRPDDLVALPWFLQKEPIRRALRKFIKPDALSVNNEVDERTIDRLLSKGYPVFLWTIDDEERIAWALAKRPYGIISDEPELVKQIRDK